MAAAALFPPPAEQLPERIEQLCAFANASGGDGPFVHPVLRAILLHFWLAYDHPFLEPDDFALESGDEISITVEPIVFRGNLLQRTRCPYFRDVSWRACNKREPGSGCSAS